MANPSCVLITGGAGFIGSHLAEYLLKRGYYVRVIDSLEPQVHGKTDKPRYLSDDVEFILGNMQDRATLAQALNGVDMVVHFAAQVGVGQSQYQIARYVIDNVGGTANLLDIIANSKCAVQKFLVASSMSIYGEGLYRRASDQSLVTPRLRSDAYLDRGDFELRDPDTGEILQPVPTPETKPLFCESIYALSKKHQEEYCLLFGRVHNVPVVACRFFNVYGPCQSLSNPYTGTVAIFLSRIKNDRPPLIYEDGNQMRDFIHVRDVVRACLLLLENDQSNGQVYNIGTGRPTSILDLANALMRLAGKELEPQILGAYRSGDIRHCYADIRKLESLGFKSEISLDEGLQDLYQWSLTQPAYYDEVEQAHSELLARDLVRHPNLGLRSYHG